MPVLNNLSGPTTTQAQLDYNKANLKPTTTGGGVGDFIDMIATAAHLPEIGFSEAVNGGQMTTNTANPAGVDLTGNIYNETPTKALSFSSGSRIPTIAETGLSQDAYNQLTSGINTATQNYNRNALSDQKQQLLNLLNRVNTYESQGLQKNQQEYDKQLGLSNADKEKQMAAYGDQEVAQSTGREKSFNEANKTAGNSYRSLAQIIGRAGGTGSSAFRELLPDAIGKGLNENRGTAIENYATNMQGIKKSKDQYGLDFASVLQDLLDQKSANESTLRTGLEDQRQSIYGKQATNAAEMLQNENPYADYSAIKAAQSPYQAAIDNSMNTVDSFFSKYNTPYVAKQAVAKAPELSEFTTNRAAINAQGQGMDASNPYASLLRKKLLQEQG